MTELIKILAFSLVNFDHVFQIMKSDWKNFCKQTNSSLFVYRNSSLFVYNLMFNNQSDYLLKLLFLDLKWFLRSNHGKNKAFSGFCPLPG